MSKRSQASLRRQSWRTLLGSLAAAQAATRPVRTMHLNAPAGQTWTSEEVRAASDHPSIADIKMG